MNAALRRHPLTSNCFQLVQDGGITKSLSVVKDGQDNEINSTRQRYLRLMVFIGEISNVGAKHRNTVDCGGLRCGVESP